LKIAALVTTIAILAILAILAIIAKMCRHSHAYLCAIALVALWFAFGIAHLAVGGPDRCDPRVEQYRDTQISTLDTHVAMLQRRVTWMQSIPEPDRPVKYEQLRVQLSRERRALLQLQRDRVVCMMQ
jgi:hypothetical protein